MLKGREEGDIVPQVAAWGGAGPVGGWEGVGLQNGV